MRLFHVAVAASFVFAAAASASAECPKNAAGQPMVTGKGNVDPKAPNAGIARLGAERAAFLDALRELKACLGEQAKTVTGWGIAEVRYYDSDPVVEVDLTPAFDAAPQVTVMGSALPNAAKMATTANVAQARVQTTRAAVTVAQRNAKEALAAAFPADGPAGAAKAELSGALGGCATADVAYWDDGAVSVRITCGRGVEAPKEAPKPHPAPPVQPHGK